MLTQLQLRWLYDGCSSNIPVDELNTFVLILQNKCLLLDWRETLLEALGNDSKRKRLIIMLDKKVVEGNWFIWQMIDGARKGLENEITIKIEYNYPLVP